MTKKQPDFLNEQVASAFQEKSVVKAYQYRPEYPAETFEFLASLVPENSKRILDVGCGTGFVARHLVAFIKRIDAVDISDEMIAVGKNLPNGNHPNLNWHIGKAEETFPEPPYGLITAGQSLHWMDWETIMPRFANAIVPEGFLAILHPKQDPVPWDKELTELIRTYSTTRDFRKFDLVTELEQRKLFQTVGRKITNAVLFEQSLKDYIESFHGRASFSRDRMKEEDAASFDQTLQELVSPFLHRDKVQLSITAEIIWGKPRATHSK
jgi:SAM-dependent methyltransferase